MKKIYYLTLLLLLVSACKVPLEVTPENVTVDCKEQDLTFHSNVGYSFMEIDTYYTDYPEFRKSVENGYIIRVFQ